MTARTVNGFAVLRFASALRVTARPLHGRTRLSGRGTSFRLRRRSQPLRGIEQGTWSEFGLSGTAAAGGEIARRLARGACGASLPVGSPYRAFGWFSLVSAPRSRSRAPVKLLGGKMGKAVRQDTRRAWPCPFCRMGAGARVRTA
uniref:Uncharacterized protein n=1 Tax=uncultured prokaryote TaxID=198431 RepID=A0A0H5QI36_9ZZZZ|nr:hypothetical protein [uncultured prokaryote]